MRVFFFAMWSNTQSVSEYMGMDAPLIQQKAEEAEVEVTSASA
jgi:hypothetical protein